MSACVIMWVALHENGVSTVHVWGIPFAHSKAILPVNAEQKLYLSELFLPSMEQQQGNAGLCAASRVFIKFTLNNAPSVKIRLRCLT